MQIGKKQARTTSKYAIAKYTQALSTSNITALQRTRKIFFFFYCTSALLLGIVKGLSPSLMMMMMMTTLFMCQL